MRISPLTRTAVVATALAVTLLVSRSASPAAPADAPAFASLPMRLGDWAGAPAPPLAADVMASLSADRYIRRYYTGRSGAIEMDLAYYGQPRVGANMHSPLNCLPGNGWEITSVNHRELATTIGRVPVRELTVAREGARYALTYWFQSRHRIVANELSARLHLLGDALQRRPADASLVRLIMPGAGASQRDEMAAFAARLIPAIDFTLR